MLNLAVWQDTCHTYKNLVYDLAHHESPIAQWLERPAGIWKVMGSTFLSISTWECFSVIYTLYKSPIYLSLRRELKVRRVAEYLWLTARCLEIWSNTVECVILSSQLKLELGKTKKYNPKNLCVTVMLSFVYIDELLMSLRMIKRGNWFCAVSSSGDLCRENFHGFKSF